MGRSNLNKKIYNNKKKIKKKKKKNLHGIRVHGARVPFKMPL